MNKMDLKVDHIWWEAVRRNEKYKKWYKVLSEHGSENNDLKFLVNKTDIKQKLESAKCYHDNNWFLIKLWDPSLSIDDIDCEIINGARTDNDYPYSHLLKHFNQAATAIKSPEYVQYKEEKTLFLSWLNVNRTIQPFMINHHDRREVHAKETLQL